MIISSSISIRFIFPYYYSYYIYMYLIDFFVCVYMSRALACKRFTICSSRFSFLRASILAPELSFDERPKPTMLTASRQVTHVQELAPKVDAVLHGLNELPPYLKALQSPIV